MLPVRCVPQPGDGPAIGEPGNYPREESLLLRQHSRVPARLAVIDTAGPAAAQQPAVGPG